MAKNQKENNRPKKWVSREIFKFLMLTEIGTFLRHWIFKFLMISCYVVGIILTGIGTFYRNNGPHYDKWLNTIDCGNIDLCGVVFVISFSTFFEVLFLFVSLILFLFFAYEILYQFLSKKSPNQCIGCLAIKLFLLLFLSYFFFIEEIFGDIKWGGYIL
jgi:hypothetical protein